MTVDCTMPEYGRKKMKSMVLFVVIAFMFLAVDAAYGLGGGGHHGDDANIFLKALAMATRAAQTAVL